ncbi:DUF1080 domain-containing protein [Larkinella insperata]|uniref:DUF1080 domain-containing protein n=1 Tax=Larkinella insperata TaxID=332158 RepID=A0ABW3Q6D9_9BACT|nr:DUF1080 domain-containing protein [Larkinella insperata]
MKKATFAIGLLAGLFTLMSLSNIGGSKPGKWVPLFDGKSTAGWHSYLKDKAIGWNIENGTLTPDGTGGDLVTDKEYENFDLEFEFKLPPKSNSGVVYKVIEDPANKATYWSGPEYQVIDDKGYQLGDGAKLKGSQLTGANYDLIAPNDPTVNKPAGEWNKGRIMVNNNHVEHYLNGKKVVEYEYGGPEWQKMANASKFKDWAYVKPHAKGKIALQNHSPKEVVWYRNIRIREL